ncbi:MAG: molybdate ABC transporter substrate-binding protein, partial [Desulfamplus sp.]|nr:molybdate ABC transporter substrate-binding protein [Desulfamplus sp.]
YFEKLKNQEFKKIAIGNPKSVPAGRYAQDILIFYEILPYITDKLIYTENARQVLDYVVQGEVDAGIVYATDATLRSKGVVVISTAPESSHKPVVYTVAMIKETKNKDAAKKFISLVMSQEGQAVLNKHGFKSVK